MTKVKVWIVFVSFIHLDVSLLTLFVLDTELCLSLLRREIVLDSATEVFCSLMFWDAENINIVAKPIFFF